MQFVLSIIVAVLFILLFRVQHTTVFDVILTVHRR